MAPQTDYRWLPRPTPSFYGMLGPSSDSGPLRGFTTTYKTAGIGHTDTQHTTALHVPSNGLVISGDAVYNNTHLYLAECDEKARVEWLRALDKIEALHPTAVVAGHGVLNPDSSPRHIDETRRYLHDFNASLASTSTTLDLYQKMLTLHPNRVNPGSLWATAKTVKPS
jgi:glyoxylase-like metal-dependent hydrolase (beta-lactamase superfamily II)